jgi:hypothetical protein
LHVEDLELVRMQCLVMVIKSTREQQLSLASPYWIGEI